MLKMNLMSVPMTSLTERDTIIMYLAVLSLF